MLVYTTPPLEDDTEVTGPITVTLYASSSATDTDFTAKLDDVYPDGASMLIEYSIQRARYRISETNPTLIKPGTTHGYTIHVSPTSNLFKAEHQIRLEISSGNFPMFDHMPKGPRAREIAIGTMGLLIGTLQMARAVDHPSLSEEILAAGTHVAGVLIQSGKGRK